MTFIIDSLGNTQQAFELLKSIQNHPAVPSRIVTSDTGIPCLRVQCSVLPPSSLLQTEGIIVAFGLRGMEMANCAISRKLEMYHFCYDLEWMRGPIRNREEICHLYTNGRFIPAVRGKSHLNAFCSAFNTEGPSGLSPDGLLFHRGVLVVDDVSDFFAMKNGEVNA